MRKMEDSYKKFTDTLWEEGAREKEYLKPQVKHAQPAPPWCGRGW